MEMSAHHIHCHMRHLTAKYFYFTLIYGSIDDAERIQLWSILKSYEDCMTEPWLIGGDFNNVLAIDERVGGNTPLAEIRPFKDCIEACGLQDLQFTGNFYTWTNRQIFSKIDQVLINQH